MEDALRFIVSDNPQATILDFFSGSGTTAHAVMRLNRQDGGRRQCISVTNNEVGADEHADLRKEGLRPGDADWEKLGICDLNRPGFPRGLFVQNSGGFFKSIHLCMEFVLQFLRRPMAIGAV